jgi:hypothetical protein
VGVQVEIPFYPNSTVIFWQSMMAVNGARGMVQNHVTADPPDVVIAFYEEKLGAAQRDVVAESATWHFGDTGGGQHLEVWPITGAYPFRGAPGSLPPPPDAKTVIDRSYLCSPEDR